MPTRLRRPSKLKQLSVTALLIGFLAYLGFSAVSGQYGIANDRDMREDIERLNAEGARLQAEIDAYEHRISLFDPRRTDPDILTERARALLAMTHKDDIVIVVDQVK